MGKILERNLRSNIRGNANDVCPVFGRDRPAGEGPGSDRHISYDKAASAQGVRDSFRASKRFDGGNMIHSGITLPNVSSHSNMICSASPCDMLIMKHGLDSPHERLAWAREKAGFLDKAAFAKVVGVNPTTYRAYENGQNGFAKLAPKFAKSLGVTTEWLLEGGDTPNVATSAASLPSRVQAEQPRIIRSNEGTVRLRVIDLNLAMGDGGNLDDWASDDEYIDFDQSVLRLITRAPAESVIIAYPKGDSMFPTLLNGDMAVIDTTQQTLNLDGKIWACSIYGAGAVKRLNASGRGRIEVRSDNPIAGNREVDAEDVRILGRVIWVGREV